MKPIVCHLIAFVFFCGKDTLALLKARYFIPYSEITLKNPYRLFETCCLCKWMRWLRMYETLYWKRGIVLTNIWHRWMMQLWSFHAWRASYFLLLNGFDYLVPSTSWSWKGKDSSGIGPLLNWFDSINFLKSKIALKLKRFSCNKFDNKSCPELSEANCSLNLAH